MSEPILAEAIGTIDGVNTDFTTPSPYYPGTLFAYLNGLLVQQAGDEGPIELGANAVRMRDAPRPGDTLHFYYDTQPPTGGAILGPPTMLEAINLVPVIAGSLNLRPDIIGADDESATSYQPDMSSATPLVPEIDDSIDLRPEIISAEEV